MLPQWSWPQAAVLTTPDVTQVLLADANAPLVTFTFDENALVPAAPLLRIPYLERLLEAVRSGTQPKDWQWLCSQRSGSTMTLPLI